MSSADILIEAAKVLLAPVLAAFTALWVFNRQNKETIHCAVDWDWMGGGPDTEIPFIAVQNRTSGSVMVMSLKYKRGILGRTLPDETALYWEDPADLNFPYEIASHATRKFQLSSDEVAKRAAKAGRLSQFLRRWFNRPRIWICVTTMAGTKATTSLEPVVPFSQRPENAER